MDSEAKYDIFLNEFLPGSALAPQREAIKKEYDCKKKYLTYRLCVAAIIAHGVFTCNTRDLATAYPEQTYMMEYEFPVDGMAFHGSDLIPEFMNTVEEAVELLKALGIDPDLAPLFANSVNSLIRHPYQSYFASFGVYGNPNVLSHNGKKEWPVVDGSGDLFTDVLRAKMGFSPGLSFDYIEDKKNSLPICSFWKGIAHDIVESKSAYSDDKQVDIQQPIGSEL